MKQNHEKLLRDYLDASLYASDFKLQKYVRVAQVLQRMIDERHWKPGDQLPTEAELVGILDISLGTVQKALAVMADKGMLAREQGRGTFVTSGRTPDEDLLYFRFFNNDRTGLLPIYTRVLDRRIITETGPWSDFLSDAEGVVRIRRFMSVNGEFDIYSEVYLGAARFRDIADFPPESLNGASIYKLLSERFNASTQRVAQRLRCSALPPPVCKTLELTPGTVGITWELLSYGARNEPLSYQRVFMPPSSRTLQISDMAVSRYQAMASASFRRPPSDSA